MGNSRLKILGSKNIELSCDKLLDLYEDLEYFAKKEAKLEQKTQMDVKDIVEKELRFYMDAFSKKGLSLTSSVESCLCQIDKKGLAISLSNLLSNALKFTSRAV